MTGSFLAKDIGGLSCQTTGIVHRVLYDDLGLSKKVASWVPRLLTEGHGN